MKINLIKNNLLQYIMYVLFCIKILEYGKKKNYFNICLFFSINLSIKLIFDLSSELTIFISFIITNCFIKIKRKIEYFSKYDDWDGCKSCNWFNPASCARCAANKALDTAEDVYNTSTEDVVDSIVSGAEWTMNKFESKKEEFFIL